MCQIKTVEIHLFFPAVLVISTRIVSSEPVKIKTGCTEVHPAEINVNKNWSIRPLIFLKCDEGYHQEFLLRVLTPFAETITW